MILSSQCLCDTMMRIYNQGRPKQAPDHEAATKNKVRNQRHDEGIQNSHWDPTQPIWTQEPNNKQD